MKSTYINKFGGINKEQLLVSITSIRKTFSLDSIVKIKFVKKQEYRINSALFLLSIFLVVFLFLNTSWSVVLELFIFLLSLFLVVSSYFFKSYHSSFIVYTKNNFTDVPVRRGLSKDAEVLSLKINALVDFNKKSDFRKAR